MPTCYYEPNALVIRIPTNCPAALHSRLLKALGIAFRLCLVSRGNARKDDLEELTPLVDIQEAMTPEEEQLLKMAS